MAGSIYLTRRAITADMKTLPQFKRGDSFALSCIYKLDGVASSLVGMSIASQIRTVSNDLIATLAYAPDADQVAHPGLFSLIATSGTAAWPIEGLRCDIQITKAGVITSSDTFLVPIVQDITQ
jgi:hypothetical protein